ncbi:MAG TPA: hypothetical protein ENH19_02715 [Actinobacteria bacterium]|nr:hypothetical protein [Actinomycetes bacterium]HEX21547.1 hypothetical protein [Actinomycetota bacterium]
MALRDIFLALEREAKSQNEETMSRAQEEAEELISAAKVKAKLIMAEETDRAKEELRSQASKIILEARFRTKKSLVEQKEELIEAVFTEAGQRLEALAKSQEYSSVFINLAREAADTIAAGSPIEVIVNQDKLPAAKSIFADRKFKPTFKSSSNNVSGIVISLDKGRKVLTNTLDSRLELARKKLKVSIGELLFDA